MTEPSRTSGWRPRLGAAIACCLLLAGCSRGTAAPGGGTDATTSSTSAAAPASTTTPGPPPGAALPPSEEVVVDGPALLADALAAYEAGYEFNSRAIVNGAPAVVVDGRMVAGVSEMMVSSGDATVEYLTAGPQQWTRLEGGEWDLIADDAAAGSPLAIFTAPTALVPESVTGDTVVLRATYPAGPFGLAGDTVDVRLTVTGGFLTETAYVAAQPVRAEVTTSFRPLTDTTPITPPPA